MAPPEIQLDLDELQSDVIALNETLLKEINTVMTSACNSIAMLTISGWEGESKDKFMETFSDYKKEMRLFYENLSAFNTCLEDIYKNGESVYTEGDALLDVL